MRRGRERPPGGRHSSPTFPAWEDAAATTTWTGVACRSCTLRGLVAATLFLYAFLLSFPESIYRRGARRWRKLYRANGHLFQAKRFNRVSGPLGTSPSRGPLLLLKAKREEGRHVLLSPGWALFGARGQGHRNAFTGAEMRL